MHIAVLALFLCLPLLAQEEDREEFHASIGISCSLGRQESRLGTGWITTFGSGLWFSERSGLRSELSYQQMGLSEEIRQALPSGTDGNSNVLSLSIQGVHRFHGAEATGFYGLLGAGAYRHEVVFTNLEEKPSTTKGGWVLGLGWEGRALFFELQVHRFYTAYGPVNLVPLVMGTRF